MALQIGAKMKPPVMDLRKKLRSLAGVLARALGSEIVDYQTGRPIARAFMICFGGRVYLFGLKGSDQVIPVFLPQPRMSFWKRTIGFTVHPPPDFPSEPPASSP